LIKKSEYHNIFNLTAGTAELVIIVLVNNNNNNFKQVLVL
jgi:hypothetical protein